MSYTYWKLYFENNQSHFKNINWDEPDSFSTEEQTVITKSIRQFQEGENSEGKHLLKYAKTLQDAEYLSAIRLFIKEEQCHTLNNLYQKKNLFSQFISRGWHLFLMTGTIFIVWWYHKQVLRKGGYYFSRFFFKTMQVFWKADALVKNKNLMSRQPFTAAAR